MRNFEPTESDVILIAGKAVQRLIYYEDINKYKEEEKQLIIQFKETCLKKGLKIP